MTDKLDNIVEAYVNNRQGSIPANEYLARSAMKGGTSGFNDKSGVSIDFPVYDPEKCTGCGDCYTYCPDFAVYLSIVKEDDLEKAIKKASLTGQEANDVCNQFSNITEMKNFRKYVNNARGNGLNPDNYYAAIIFDYSTCKGCGECAEICKQDSLNMAKKYEGIEKTAVNLMKVFRELPTIDKRFGIDNVMADYTNRVMHGGHGACMGCGQPTALGMMGAATYNKYGSFVVAAATGCNTVYSSTWPWAAFSVPWTTSLFENAPAIAIGLREGLNNRGERNKKIWVAMGDGAAYDIGFQSLSRLLSSGLDVNVLVLDTGAYSNTGGQASTATFRGAEAQMAAHGKIIHGKEEERKNLINIAMTHNNIFAAQVSTAYKKHFFNAINDANSFPGPSIVIAYTPCQPEHRIGDNQSYNRAKAAVLSRASPLVVYDPRKGKRLHERISLKGNPSMKEDWHSIKENDLKTVCDFLWFAKGEGRFAKHFKNDEPTSNIIKSQEEILEQWRLLQELARII